MNMSGPGSYLRIFLKLFTVALCANSAFGEYDNIGTAPYAMLSKHWPCELQQKSDASQEELRMAVVWNTFGNETECLSNALQGGKLKALEIHLINEVCQRHNSCASYEFVHGMTIKQYTKRLKNRNKDLLEKLNNYLQAPARFVKEFVPDSVSCYISVGLESNLTKEAAQVLIEEVTPLFPQCKIVWNPNGVNPHASPIKGTVFELHHSDKPLDSPCIANLDGEDISFPSRPAVLSPSIKSADLPAIAQRFSNCDLNFLWIAEYNGLTAGAFVDPRERTAKVFPSEATFDLVNAAKEDIS